ncbi:MAG: M1 family metallopeptidase [Saprospiraceae bacterium]|nr:M1 family metallopeptidase [Saprospiraceae bacterium]MBK7796830.1 M1 family metallopeptidase [Saprospiraceae bacterium]MBL0259791.1 M1 family metallopeptidase [Saprospiraceae bacterium]
MFINRFGLILKITFYLLIVTFLFFECKPGKDYSPQALGQRPDPHSFSRPDITAAKHLNLNLKLNFEKKIIEGRVDFTLSLPHGNEFILDNLGLQIDSVFVSAGGQKNTAKFANGITDSILGQPMIIPVDKQTDLVTVYYKTSPEALALQWMDPELTASKKLPFFFTQSQSIFARSWVPCQDGPGIRFTYDATVEVPVGMMAAMSARNPTEKQSSGIYQFKMDIPIPAYLMALAAGDFAFKPIGPRTGVYAEPGVLERAHYEFADLEKMLITAEELYGHYPWGRYDVIVLPSSFPFGGMENPMLTFATPTILVGDRSLTSLLAHELAHSWSGNLVTNSTWNDFWLNEGFTTYFESRIMEQLYGKEYADMLSLLGYQDLQKTLVDYGTDNPLTKLKGNYSNPEDGLSDIAYEKGKIFLRYLEEKYGRPAFDTFLKTYFHQFEFSSMTTEKFRDFLSVHLLNNDSSAIHDVDSWLYGTGMPAFMPSYQVNRFKAVDIFADKWKSGQNPSKAMTTNWSTHEWLHFIRQLPVTMMSDSIKLIDESYSFSKTANAEIRFAWIQFGLESGYRKNIIPSATEFLLHTGRRKFVLPIYENMIKVGFRKEAEELYAQAKSSYHPITRRSIEEAFEEAK